MNPTREEVKAARDGLLHFLTAREERPRASILPAEVDAVRVLIAATDPALNGPGTESIGGQHFCRNCGEQVVHSWEECARELRQALEAAVQE